MAFKFETHNAPPTLAEIESERKRIEEEREKIQKKLMPFILGMFAAVISLVIFQLTVLVPVVRHPDTSPTFLAVVALFIPYMAFILFFIANHYRHKIIENPRKALRAELALIEEVPQEQQENFRSEIQSVDPPAEVEAYLGKVEVQGRNLLQGEIDSLRRAIKESGGTGARTHRNTASAGR